MEQSESFNEYITDLRSRCEFIRSTSKASSECILDAFLQIAGAEIELYNITEEIKTIVNWAVPSEDDYSKNKKFYNKGLLLIGGTGTGKTTTMRFLSRLLSIARMQYRQNGETKTIGCHVVHSKKIVHDFNTNGYDMIDYYSSLDCLCIDDLGNEPKVNNYGVKFSPIEDIIQYRADNRLLTFGTTNVSKFEGIYDERTLSRMSALFNPILLNNKDYRRC